MFGVEKTRIECVWCVCAHMRFNKFVLELVSLGVLAFGYVGEQTGRQISLALCVHHFIDMLGEQLSIYEQ